MTKVSVNNMDVYYEEQGSGDEVVLLVQHGGQSKNEMLSLLPPEYHIFIVDLPGYGRSTNLKKFRGFELWSNDIYKFSQKLHLKKFTYIGTSMTGIVGFQLALDHPEIIKALIPIVSIPVSNVPLPGPEEQKALDSGTVEEHTAVTQKGFLFPKSTTDKERLRRRELAQRHLGQRRETTDREALSFLQEQILRTKEGREKFIPRLKDIKVPTLLLLGAYDYSNPLDQAIISAMSIPGSKAVFFEDYGHGLSIESPEKVADEIIMFINDLNRNK